MEGVSKKVVTRFAPSPTGYLHIGGARTAVFNWAFARRHGGRFILRMEDTDQARSTPESTRRILEDLAWLGLDWDEGPPPPELPPEAPAPEVSPELSPSEDTEAALGRKVLFDPYTHQKGEHGPYFQSQRLEIYRQYVQKLMDSGRAYKCFKTPAELAREREEAVRQKRPYKYDPTESMSLTASQIAEYESQGRPCVVRFHMPQTDIVVNDLILGQVTVKAEELEDFVILKSDGYPTFHLANVVDDYLMEVTHVLRAQEHLMNTPKHVALQQAFGFPSPAYAHMPLIFNPDGTKMSKRDKAKAVRAAAGEVVRNGGGDVAALWGLCEQRGVKLSESEKQAVEGFLAKKSDDLGAIEKLVGVLDVTLPEIDVHDFRASGYLPGVVVNYIALLGWSPGQDVERFGPQPLEYLSKHFDLERIGKSNARFDREKLRAFNTDAILALTPEEFERKLAEYGREFHPWLMEKLGQRFGLFAGSYRERSRTLAEPFVNGRFLGQKDEQLQYDGQAVKKVLAKNGGEGYEVLRQLKPVLEACEDWSVGELERIIERFAAEKGVGLGKVAQPVRVAVTGGTVSPPIYDTLVILGKRAALARIERCLNMAQGVAAGA